MSTRLRKTSRSRIELTNKLNPHMAPFLGVEPSSSFKFQVYLLFLLHITKESLLPANINSES